MLKIQLSQDGTITATCAVRTNVYAESDLPELMLPSYDTTQSARTIMRTMQTLGRTHGPAIVGTFMIREPEEVPIRTRDENGNPMIRLKG